MSSFRCARSAAMTAAPLLSVVVILAFRPPTRGGASSSNLNQQSTSQELSGTRRPGERPVELHQPTLLPLESDRALLLVVEYRLGEGDRLLAADIEDGQVQGLLSVDSTPRKIVRPTACRRASGDPQIFFAEIEGGVARLKTAWRSQGRWSAIERLATGDGAAFNQDCCLCDDKVWVVWQDYAGRGAGGSYDIRLASVEDNRLVDERVIADSVRSEWDPAIVTVSHERLCIAWVAFSGKDYEIQSRFFDVRTRSLSEVVCVSEDPLSDDLHPSLIVDKGGVLWFAWDALRDPARGKSFPGDAEDLDTFVAQDSVLRVARLKESGLEVLKGSDRGAVATERLSGTGAVPRLFVDEHGEVGIAYRSLRGGTTGPRHSYPVCVQRLGQEGWSSPQRIEQSDGSEECAAVTLVGGRAVVAYQRDFRERQGGLSLSPTKEDSGVLKELRWFLQGDIGPSTIGVSILEPASLVTGEPSWIDREAAVPAPSVPDQKPGPDPVAARIEVMRAGEKYLVYFGDLHRHSSVSRCSFGMEPEPGQRYDFGRDIHGCDFFALTDHSDHIAPFQWWQMCKLVELLHTPSFCVLQGFEWSSSEVGHMNVILRDRGDLIMSPTHPESFSLERLWKQLPAGGALTIPHHTSHDRFPTRWPVESSNFLSVVEIYQAKRGSYEFDGCFRQARSGSVVGSFVQDGLRRGLRFGFIASTDHGDGASYAAVLASSLNRADVFDALSRRRTYATTTRGLLVDLRVDDHWMGEEFTTSAPPRISWDVRSDREIAEIVLLRGGDVIRRVGQGPKSYLKNAEFVLELTPEPPSADCGEVRLTVDKGRFVSAVPGMKVDHLVDTPWWKQTDLRSITWQPPSSVDESIRRKNTGVRLRARDESILKIEAGDGGGRVAVKDLRERPVRRTANGCSVRVSIREIEKTLIDRSQGIGSSTHVDSFIDDAIPAGASWYYLRVIRTDGELAWSSPIFVSYQKP